VTPRFVGDLVGDAGISGEQRHAGDTAGLAGQAIAHDPRLGDTWGAGYRVRLACDVRNDALGAG